MLLLYLSVLTVSGRERVDLHSTMLLLYRTVTEYIGMPKTDLHSTMLLLYRYDPSHHIRHIQFTFHYASTLSVAPQPIQVLFSSFTFHYASTLSQSTERLRHGYHIYIPLCFYFIKCVYHFCGFLDDIYIPLCFYFIAGRTTLRSAVHGIYIPLCFYFINEEITKTVREYEFTFHYASTLSPPEDLSMR